MGITSIRKSIKYKLLNQIYFQIKKITWGGVSLKQKIVRTLLIIIYNSGFGINSVL